MRSLFEWNVIRLAPNCCRYLTVFVDDFRLSMMFYEFSNYIVFEISIGAGRMLMRDLC